MADEATIRDLLARLQRPRPPGAEMVNPDGVEAAGVILALWEEVEALRARVPVTEGSALAVAEETAVAVTGIGAGAPRPGENPQDDENEEWRGGFLTSLNGLPRDETRGSEWRRGWQDGEDTKEQGGG